MTKQLTTTTAQAIVQMGRGVPDYNRGVLAMLGQESLAWAHNSARGLVSRLVAQREAHLAGANMFDSQATPVDAQLDAANAEERAAWAPIEALIAQAMAHLDGDANAAPAYGEHV